MPTINVKTGEVTYTPDELESIEKAEAVAHIPKSITPRQCRLILMSQGLLSTVEAMISQQDEATKITWEYALEFRRDDPLLLSLAANLNLTSKQVDEFFIAAAQL